MAGKSGSGAVLVASFLFLALGFALWGCGTASNNLTGDSGFVRSEAVRASASTADEDSAATLVADNNAFGLELFRAVRATDQNLVCSPYGLSAVLAMTFAGATGETEQEMARVLHFHLPQTQFHDAFNALDQGLTASGDLRIANSLWGSNNYTFNRSFIDLLARDYGAGLALLDFRKTEEAREAINAWVKEKTSGRIPQLVAPNEIKLDPPPMLMLVDAVYFKAEWEKQFPKGSTRDWSFNLLGGQTVEVSMMQQRDDEVFSSGEGSDFQAVELPYAGGQYSMVLILPAEGKFEDFASTFDDAKLAEVLGSLEERQIEVLLPRFEFRSAPDVQAALKSLGMIRAFELRGDLFGMLDASKGLPGSMKIDGVKQKAFISVGELGTEAAAASAVTVVAGAALVEHNRIIFNRPFLYLIRDTESGQIVFMGQVVDPSQVAK